ncbi:MAG TPA: DoxX family protein [Polyangiaceae bacterium]
MTLQQRVTEMNRQLQTLKRQCDWMAPLIARITLGILFISTGWGKVHDLTRVTAFFAQLGIPAPAFHATLVSYVELVGGALLLVGLFAELAAIPLMISMLVAIVTAKRGEVEGLPDLFGLVEWTYFVLLVWVALAGAGKASLAAIWHKRSNASSALPRSRRVNRMQLPTLQAAVVNGPCPRTNDGEKQGRTEHR